MKIQPQNIYNSKILKSCFAFASDNSALFAAGASLVLSSVVRPIAISLTPKTDEENKKYAITKSFASSAVGFLITLIAANPVSKAIKNIDSNPSLYLKESTIAALKEGENSLKASKKYNFATQLFKLGLGFFLAAPKSFLTSSLISPLMKRIFPKKDENKTKKETPTKIDLKNFEKFNNPSIQAFKGKLYDKYTDKLTQGISTVINSKTTQNLADKFSNTNFEHHMMNAQDILTTGLFVYKTMGDKKLDDNRKKVLSINSVLSTGLSVVGGLSLSKFLEKPCQKFIENFKEANKTSPDLAKYVEGIKVAKSTAILAGIYYIFIPVISTFSAERIEKLFKQNHNFLKSEAGCLHNGQMKSSGNTSPS